ncbi:endo-1,4-beta-xylanase [Cytophagaceae bacterium ABcell3]|nr:endo-1,4-beta-xylanase [Cytophagaceae bacterium ABcell3]
MKKLYFLTLRRMLLLLVFLNMSFLSANAQNLLSNGDFEDGDTDWNHQAGGTSNASFDLVTDDVYSGSNALRVQANTLGAESWDIQSIHSGWEAEVGRDYQVTIHAKADQNGKRLRLVNQNEVYLTHAVTLSTEWNSYTWTFTAQESNPSFRLHYIETGTFHIDDISIEVLPEIEPPVLETSLKELGEYCGLYVGTAVADAPLRNETHYRNTIIQQFGMVVAENEMKMETIKPSEDGPYNFEPGDRLVDFAEEHGMQVRGHALLWHSQMPRWMNDRSWTKQELMDYLKEYITTVVTHYKGKIQEWDVANEVISDGPGNPIRDELWFNIGGVEIIDSAFKWAHEADPDCKLYYNDYSAETMNSKSDAVYDLVNGLKERGAPIYGVGLQSHRNYNEGLQMHYDLITQMDQNIKRIGELGLKVAITELDLGIHTPVTEQDYQDQAATYANILQVALDNRPTIETFCLWGFTDKHSWIPNFSGGERDEALIFDHNYFPKPAYDALVETFENCTPPETCDAEISYEGSRTLCEGDSLELTATEGASYVWRKDGDNIGTSRTLWAKEDGEYNVEVTYANGCTGTSESLGISVDPKPEISYEAPTVVLVEPAVISFSAELANGGGDAWKLKNESGEIIYTEEGENFNFEEDGFEAGEHSFILIATTESCIDSVEITFNVEECPKPEFLTYIQKNEEEVQEVDSMSVPDEASVRLIPETEQEGIWSWTGPNGFEADTREITIEDFSESHEGEYEVTFVNECGRDTSIIFTLSYCYISDILPFAFVNEEEIESKEIIVAEGDELLLDPRLLITSTPGPEPYPGQPEDGWYWAGPNDFVSNERQVSIESASVEVSGTYTVSYTAECGTKQIRYEVQVQAEPAIDCNGDEGGTAEIDECDVCAGGETGIEPGYTCAEPEIESISEDIEVEEGEELTLTVTASGPGELSYQWFRNGQAIEGATDATYTVTEAAVSDAGTYHVVVSNENGDTQSASVEATIVQGIDCNGDEGGTAYIDDCDVCAGGNTGIEPGFTCAEPTVEVVSSDINVEEGEDFTLEVSVSGPGENTYQWFKDGEPIEGAIESTYTVPSASGSDAGSYHVVVTNDNGATTSDPIQVSIASAPEVDCNGDENGTAEYDECDVCAGGNTGIEPGFTCAEPTVEVISSDINVEEGEDFTLEVSVSGPGENTYQWFKDGEPIEGATESTFTVPSASGSDAGSYYVVVTNDNGATTSDPIQVSIATAPEIDCNGDENGTAEYDECDVCAGGNTGIEPGFTCAEPVIDAISADINVEEGEDFTLEVSVSGPGENTYQWFKDGEPIEGATESTYTVPSASGSDAGSYHVVVTNDNGSVTSDEVHVDVSLAVDCNGVAGGTAEIDECGECAGGDTGIEPGSSCPVVNPEIISIPTALEATLGEPFELNVNASGPGSFTYQWYHNNQPINGATNSTYSVEETSEEDAGTYHVVITSSNGGETKSEEITLTVTQPVDCNDDIWGDAFYDVCGICAGGNTGIEPTLDEDECVTSINGEELGAKVNVYPNPASTELFVEYQAVETKTLTLLNGLGQVVRSVNSTNTVDRFDISDLPSGVYLLVVEYEGKVQHAKIVVQ